MKLSVKTQASTKRVLVFGPPKSGKTKLVGGLAARYNLLWFDLESGVDTLFQLPQEYQERVEVISLADTRSYPIAIETCLKAIKGSAGTICETHGKWNCIICGKDWSPTIPINLSALSRETVVVFDSLTQLTNSAIAHMTKDKPEDYKLQTDDWGNLGKLLDIFLSHVQQAGFHVVCISHETEAELEDGTNRIVPVAGTRNFSRNCAKYFSDVIYCQVKLKKHIAASGTTYASNILTGSRSGLSLETMETPDLVALFTGEIPTPAAKPVSPLLAKFGSLKK